MVQHIIWIISYGPYNKVHMILQKHGENCICQTKSQTMREFEIFKEDFKVM